MGGDPNGGFVLIGFIIWFVIIGIPVMQILHRTGFSRAWVLIGIVPIVNLVFLWIYAFTRWPVEGEEERKAT
jgi:biotin transporter BioY